MLSVRERELLASVAEAALPAGRRFPGAGAETVARLETLLAEFPPGARRAYLGIARAVDGSARLRRRRRMARLEPDARAEVLETWRRAGLARRLALRALLTPLKLAHFDDPSFSQQVGCAFDRDEVQGEERPRYVRERSHDAAELDEDLELECDAVVVGTGAGGAVVARELAEEGHAVILLEEGAYFDRTDFQDRPLAQQRKLYRDMGATFSVGNTGIAIPTGRTVGGTTTVNSGTCYRTPDRVLRKWREDFGLRELTDDAMAHYYERVESVLRVETARAEFLGGVARVIARGCDRLGYGRHNPLKRNAPDCDGQGVCCFGCPTDAKRSTNVSYVPLALRAGAELFYRARVKQILVEDGRAVGVVARARGRGDRTITVRARRVVLACGTLMTPVLLQENQLLGGSGQLGRNLSIHPAAGALALFDETIAGFSAIPQGYAIEEFHEEGILFEGGQAPLDVTMTALPFFGEKLVQLADSPDRVAMFGFMIEDTSRGRVRSLRGRPLITYMLGDADVARLKRGTEILARVFLAAGARAVMPLVHGFDELRDEADVARLRAAHLRASDFELSAYHPLGTARMGSDPARSVVDESHEAHELPGLHIVDGSAVPSSLAVNPQVTIMALATRAAGKISRRLESA